MRGMRIKKLVFAFTLVFLLGALSMNAAAEEQKLIGKTVNINTATAEEFVKNVPLITPELAKKIVEYREATGDFQMLEELLQVPGFNRDLLRRITPFLLLEGLGGEECTC